MKSLISLMILSLFLSAFIDTNHKPVRDPVFLQYAEKAYFKNMKKMIQEGHNINMINKSGSTAMHVLARTGDHKMLSYLHEKGALLNKKNKLGNTPLHEAVKHSQVKNADFLLKKKAHIYKLNTYGNTAFHEMNDFKTAELFLNLNQKQVKTLLHQKNKLRQSPAHMLSFVKPKREYFKENTSRFSINHHEASLILDKMIEKDPEALFLNKKDLLGNTPLHYATACAVRTGEFSLVKKLLKYGADPNIKNKKGDSAFLIGISNKNPFKHNLKLGENQKELLSFQSQEYFHLNFYSDKTKDENRLKLLKLFSKYKADINTIDQKGNTALHFNIKKPALRSFLISKGIDEDRVNKNNKTAFDLMMQGYEKDHSSSPKREKSSILR